jgi:hypothetical protein
MLFKEQKQQTENVFPYISAGSSYSLPTFTIQLSETQTNSMLLGKTTKKGNVSLYICAGLSLSSLTYTTATQLSETIVLLGSFAFIYFCAYEDQTEMLCSRDFALILFLGICH